LDCIPARMRAAVPALALCLCASVLASAPRLATAAANYVDHPEARAFIERISTAHGLNAAELRGLFQRAERQQAVLDAISRPAERVLNWGEYRQIFITDKRIDGGVAFWDKHAELLAHAEQRYGVPAEIIVAILGVETFYGRYKGKYPALASLATLAFDYPPRSKFFTRELEEFLLLVREEGIDPLTAKGSYAAAMGMPQFISSSYRAYAVDFDDDGRRDLWHSLADVIGSVGNYFARHGWREGGAITERANPTGDAWRELADGKLKPALSREQLAGGGLEAGFEGPYTVMDLDNGEARESWVGAHNFYVITRYNHSRLYAMAVYQLATQIRARRGLEPR